jgi:hypothetical protein
MAGVWRPELGADLLAHLRSPINVMM